ncbi:MAG TPA: hypothetical protein VMF70_03890 [Gemmatimonadales bacterium]|nr:hypothetical protein [Gemmatimonadales bacterium]
MHALVRLYLRTAFAFLALGLMGGLWLEYRLTVGGVISQGMIVAHVHVLLVGFLLMMILGTAFWLFPRAGRGQPVGPHPFAVGLAYGLLTAGTVVRGVAEFFDLELSAPVWRYVALAASSVQAAGVLIGIVALWSRVRGAAAPKLAPPNPPE